jgi:hypothetical protein
MKTIDMRSQFVENPDNSGTQFEIDHTLICKFERPDYRCAMWHLLARHWHKQIQEGLLTLDQMEYLHAECFDMEMAVDELLEFTGNKKDSVSLKELIDRFRANGYTRKAQGNLMSDMEHHFTKTKKKNVSFKNQKNKHKLVGAIPKDVQSSSNFVVMINSKIINTNC